LFHGGQVVGDAGGEVGDDDLLIGIRLLGGTQARHYNFPEVPPAIISGFVFQDGSAIVLGDDLDPRDLREFRDGILTEDDTRLNGITLELRNILGLPFDSSRTLPGVYADGPDCDRVPTMSTRCSLRISSMAWTRQGRPVALL
jgi:serine-aspartate repeat-containing protein C/D/E